MLHAENIFGAHLFNYWNKDFMFGYIFAINSHVLGMDTLRSGRISVLCQC